MMYSTEYGLCAPEVLYSAIVMFVVGWMYVEGLITSTITVSFRTSANLSSMLRNSGIVLTHVISSLPVATNCSSDMVTYKSRREGFRILCLLDVEWSMFVSSRSFISPISSTGLSLWLQPGGRVAICEACVRATNGGGVLFDSKVRCNPRRPLRSPIGTRNLWEWATIPSIFFPLMNQVIWGAGRAGAVVQLARNVSPELR